MININNPGEDKMRILIVEDDNIGATMLKSILSPYGQCDMAVTGTDAVESFSRALKEKKAYSLVCLDIMLPGMDGQSVLKKIREMENQNGILGLDTAKVIMITALGDNTNILEAFRSQCEAYIVKPIRKDKVLEQIRALGIA
jgi:two-component system chemotaxis response regulator CheY